MRKIFGAMAIIGALSLAAIVVWITVNTFSVQRAGDVYFENVFSAMNLLWIALPVLFIGIWGYVSSAFSGIFGGGTKKDPFLSNGKQAMATLVGLRETGVQINHSPQLELSYQYKTESGRAVTAKELRKSSITELGMYKIGAVLPIRYFEENPQMVMLDVNAAGH